MRKSAGALAAEAAGAGEGDLTVLARRYEWDMDAIWQDLLGWLDKQPRSVRIARSCIQTLMQQAWLLPPLTAKSISAVCIC
jgi:type VI secretion system protein VasG